MIIGIDNGLKGGIAAISASHGKLIGAIPMPTRKWEHAFKKTKTRTRYGIKTKVTSIAADNEIDPAAVVAWIATITDSRPCMILVEECPEHAQQKSTMRSMAISYGILKGAILAALPECRLVVVRSGNPGDSWQRAMLGKFERTETKRAALEKAAKIWPEERWRATKRSTKPHDGMIDAALIAEYGRISNL